MSFKFCLIGLHSTRDSSIIFFKHDKFLRIRFHRNKIPLVHWVSHHSLSFSSDGRTIAGTTKDANNSEEVQFWETATDAATFSFERSSFVVFSPTDPEIAALFLNQWKSIHILKRDSFGGTM